jgi:hypothetical protein
MIGDFRFISACLYHKEKGKRGEVKREEERERKRGEERKEFLLFLNSFI